MNTDVETHHRATEDTKLAPKIDGFLMKIEPVVLSCPLPHCSRGDNPHNCIEHGFLRDSQSYEGLVSHWPGVR